MTPVPPRAPRSAPSGPDTEESASATADALFRAAVESCRQHERFSRGSAKGCSDAELTEMAELCDLGHRHLAARTAAWEKTAAAGRGANEDAFWHAANALWHASREVARRHHSCDALSTRVSRRSSGALGTLTMEYELEASALLSLKHAVAAYRKIRSEAE